MLIMELITVYCENYMEHTDTPYGQNAVRISQETHYVSATEPNWLMLIGELITVYCENHTEHTDTLCGQNAVCNSQETHYASATEPSRLMLFGETSLFNVRTIRNAQIHSVGRMQSLPHKKHITSPLQSPTG
jgi:hypothetical protein